MRKNLFIIHAIAWSLACFSHEALALSVETLVQQKLLAPLGHQHALPIAPEEPDTCTNVAKPQSELLQLQQTLASDDFAGRGTGDNQKAQALIADYFQQIGLKKFNKHYASPIVFRDEKTKRKRKGTNLVGYVEGHKYPNEYIVIGAHYDHLGMVNDTIYNGADDNASGTAALLVLAKHFAQHPPHHSFIFVAFDAEELGLHGSEYFVKHPPVPLKRMKLNFNFDMISRSAKHEIYVVGTHDYPQLKPLVAQSAQAYTDQGFLKVVYGHDDPEDETKDYWMWSSDNAPFHEKGIPNLTFSEEDHPDYHQATDDFCRVNQAFYKNVFGFILDVLAAIDKNFPNKK